MTKYDDLEKSVEKRFSSKDKKKKPPMKVSGKNIFNLQKLITSRHDRLSKGKNNKKK